MRRITVVMVMATTLASVGCTNFWGHRQQPADPGIARGPAETPTAQALVNYLNDNARRVQTVECHELSVDCRQGLRSFTLPQGQMACQQPRNFRLSAKALGSDVVDIGSNDREFWFWCRELDPPYQFHCSYEEFRRHPVRMPFPIQPEWLMEALGVAELNRPAENFEVRPLGQTFELIEKTTSGKGEPLQKVTVFKASPQRTGPQVAEHLLRDARGKIIYSAKVIDVQHDPASGGVIPHRISLEWPADRLTLTLKLDEVTFNRPLDQQRTAALFQRRVVPERPGYDLALETLDGQATGFRRASGTMPAGR